MCMLRFAAKNAGRALVAECCDFGFSASVGLRSSSVAHSLFALGISGARAMVALLPMLLHLPSHLLSRKFPCGIFNFIL